MQIILKEFINFTACRVETASRNSKLLLIKEINQLDTLFPLYFSVPMAPTIMGLCFVFCSDPLPCLVTDFFFDFFYCIHLFPLSPIALYSNTLCVALTLQSLSDCFNITKPCFPIFLISWFDPVSWIPH